MTTYSPWVSGPAELLKHGIELLKIESDTNRRLAMISIDNAVELMIKTYLGLPQRVTGLKIPRSEYQELAESFPKLLDALEKYASSKLAGIDLGEIEWYHRLRNQLYHQGNGLTVERNNVEVYAQLAHILFTNLFGFKLNIHEDKEATRLGEFLQAWTDLEKSLFEAVSLLKIDRSKQLLIPQKVAELLEHEGLITQDELKQINLLREVRNDVVYGTTNYENVINSEGVMQIMPLVNKLQQSLHMRKRSSTGIIKMYDKNKGYGFIKPDDGGADLYSHFEGVPRVKVGDKVKFTRSNTNKREQAVSVVLLK